MGRACDFMTWDVPVKDNCPACGWTMFKKSGRGFKKPFCINESCENFVPEEKRGGYRKKAADASAAKEETSAGKKGSAKKSAVKKSSASKKTASEKKSASAKKTSAKKAPAEKKSTGKTEAGE